MFWDTLSRSFPPEVPGLGTRGSPADQEFFAVTSREGHCPGEAAAALRDCAAKWMCLMGSHSSHATETKRRVSAGHAPGRVTARRLTALDGVGGDLQRQRAAAGLRDVDPEDQPHAGVLPADIGLPLAQLDVRVPQLQDPGAVDAARNKSAGQDTLEEPAPRPRPRPRGPAQVPRPPPRRPALPRHPGPAPGPALTPRLRPGRDSSPQPSAQESGVGVGASLVRAQSPAGPRRPLRGHGDRAGSPGPGRAAPPRAASPRKVRLFKVLAAAPSLSRRPQTSYRFL